MSFLRNRLCLANRPHPFEGMCRFRRAMQTSTMILRVILCLLCLALLTASRAANAPSGLLCELLEHPEETVITNTSPRFGWIYNPSFRNDSQTGYRIIDRKSTRLNSSH